MYSDLVNIVKTIATHYLVMKIFHYAFYSYVSWYICVWDFVIVKVIVLDDCATCDSVY